MPKQPREAVQGAAGPPSRERRCPIPPRRRARTPNPTTRRLFRCQGSRWRISEAPVQHRCGARTRAAARSLQTPQEQPTWQLWPPKDALRAARERRALPRGSIRYWYRYRALPTRERPSAPPVCQRRARASHAGAIRGLGYLQILAAARYDAQGDAYASLRPAVAAPPSCSPAHLCTAHLRARHSATGTRPPRGRCARVSGCQTVWARPVAELGCTCESDSDLKCSERVKTC